MTKKPIPKRIADAPSPPERHEPIANAVDELFTYYRESIAEYRKLTPEARRVKDRASWLVQGDFASQLPDKQMSKISELELALKCAEPMLATLKRPMQALLLVRFNKAKKGTVLDLKWTYDGNLKSASAGPVIGPFHSLHWMRNGAILANVKGPICWSYKRAVYTTSTDTTSALYTAYAANLKRTSVGL